MTIKVGINGFGRMGRLTLRAALEWPEVEFIKVNDVAGDAKTHAHLLEFDSVHGRLAHSVTANENSFSVGKHTIAVTNNKTISDTDWSDCDVLIEASGKMKTTELLNQYLAQGVKRVVVTAPVKEDGILNVVMGVNDNLYNPDEHKIVTAASCTTNCLAPIVKVLQEKVGIKHGSPNYY